MKINDVRQTFLDYFCNKQHKLVSSAPMVTKNDPTLMFTNAGMNQFKDFFLGYNEAKEKRVVNTQKCLRVSGKHNDLEEVGVDTYHHTMFEMLGNWSFGEYFKEEAISWAWELLVDVYKLDKSRLYVTVFEGDDSDGVPVDQESIDIWKRFIPEDHILKCDRNDNFWEMGETGPCGPSSEIHIDIRDDKEGRKIEGKKLVNKDHPQVMEIWNLVFIEFNRKANGKLEDLPAKHVDTGMGLERLAAVMQGKQTNYGIDLFQHLIAQLESSSGKKYGVDEDTDIALRVIADHIRAVSFSIADGQLPSNTGAGYVIRRILRRAIRYGYQTLGLHQPFFYSLVGPLQEVMGTAFPEISAQNKLIEKVIHEEEISFFRTLETGLGKINLLVTAAKSRKSNRLKGYDVFELYDTFGFPVDLTALIARENELEIDIEGFQLELSRQKERSRAASTIELEDWVVVKEDDIEEFIGYDMLDADIWITKYRKVKQKNKTFYQLAFNITPFYPEGGGQVGDRGFIESDSEKVVIWDTKKENNLIVHFSNELPKNVTAHFNAHVDKQKRLATEANHTATHLLHHALREVLGKHIEQKGSLVNEAHLRFDFSYFSKVSGKELLIIEQKVNEQISKNSNLYERRAVPLAVAKELGAIAPFGEKYGDLVRVIQFANSIELCGGTHVNATADIKLFKIISEGSVASGIRRIEAITADKAQVYFMERSSQFNEINDLLKRPKNLVESVKELIERNNQMTKEIEVLKHGLVKQIKAEVISQIEDKGGINYVTAILDMDGGSIKHLCFQMKSEVDNLFAVIGGRSDGKATLSIVISDELAKARGFHAGNLVRDAAKHIQGGGGGQVFFATAGGKDTLGLPNAIEHVEQMILSSPSSKN